MIHMQRLIDGLFDKPQEKRKYLGASAVGSVCKRKVQYYWLTILERLPAKDFPPRVKRIFDRGYCYEAKMVEWMKELGFVFETDEEKLQFDDFDGIFRGHCDGVLLEGPEGIEYPVLWENKCMNDKGCLSIMEMGLKHAKPEYYAQIQIYMHYLKLSKCLFTAVNADTMAIVTEEIKYDSIYAYEIVDTVKHILDQTAINKFVEKTTNKYLCKFCDFKQDCK